MIVGRKCQLSDEEAEAVYREYALWLAARENYSPSAIAKKYGVSRSCVERYGKRIHKSRRAA